MSKHAGLNCLCLLHKSQSGTNVLTVTYIYMMYRMLWGMVANLTFKIQNKKYLNTQVSKKDSPGLVWTPFKDVEHLEFLWAFVRPHFSLTDNWL